MKTKNFYFIIISTLFLISCVSTAPVTIDVLYPATENIPNNIKNIAVINKAVSQGRDTTLGKTVAGEVLFKDSIASEDCLHGFVDAIEEAKFFDVETPYNFSIVSTNKLPDYISLEKVVSLCEALNVDALLVLQMLSTDAKRKTKIEIYNSTEYLLIPRAVETKTIWNLYDVSNENIITITDSNENVSNTKYNLRKAAYYMGKKFARQISPYWLRVHRGYYIANNEMIKAHEFVNNNNWAAAAVIWRELAESEKKTIAGYACYNMALACEMQGRIDLAIEWIKKAIEKNNISAMQYYEVLKIRLEFQQQLENQLDK